MRSWRWQQLQCLLPQPKAQRTIFRHVELLDEYGSTPSLIRVRRHKQKGERPVASAFIDQNLTWETVWASEGVPQPWPAGRFDEWPGPIVRGDKARSWGIELPKLTFFKHVSLQESDVHFRSHPLFAKRRSTIARALHSIEKEKKDCSLFTLRYVETVSDAIGKLEVGMWLLRVQDDSAHFPLGCLSVYLQMRDQIEEKRPIQFMAVSSFAGITFGEKCWKVMC